jgi:gluconokinase
MARGDSLPLVLAIDIGSSSTRTALFDQSAHRIDETAASQQYSVRYSPDGGAELSPFILLRAAQHCCGQTLRKYRASTTLKKIPITTSGGSALWHGLLGLDRQLRPITPIFTWADSRAVNDAAGLRQKSSEKQTQARTGCMLRSTFWPAKLLWLKRTRPQLFRRVAIWASPTDWIFRELFGAIGCSASMASATGLYNLRRKIWDNELIEICGLRLEQLSDIREIAGRIGRAPRELHDAKIFTPIGDGAASNLGSGADGEGIVAINIGTSAAVRMIQTNRQAAQTKLPFGLFRYIVDPERSVIGGAVSNAGNLRQWCLRALRLEEKSAQIDRALSRTAAAADRLVILPFWVGERAPTWPDRQLGVIDGLNQSTRATDVFRAITTSVFYRLAEILDLIESATGRSRRIIVSGGILRSRAAITLLADALGRALDLAPEPEASLRGAALHALNQLGIKTETATACKSVKYNRALAAKHRERRQGQVDLEMLLASRWRD